MSMQNAEVIFTAVANYGFPMILSWYLLARMEAKIDKLSSHIEALADSIKNA